MIQRITLISRFLLLLGSRCHNVSYKEPFLSVFCLTLLQLSRTAGHQFLTTIIVVAQRRSVSLIRSMRNTDSFANQITIVNTMKLHVAGHPTSIGGPTPNNNVYILDENMNAVAIGEPGIMWAGGAGISRGYVDLPEKTAERYKLDPFTNDGWVVSALSIVT